VAVFAATYSFITLTVTETLWSALRTALVIVGISLGMPAFKVLVLLVFHAPLIKTST
jgi:hypothetical protein